MPAPAPGTPGRATPGGGVTPAPRPAGVTAAYSTAARWDAGYAGDIVVTNSAASPSDWTIDLILPKDVAITNVSNAVADAPRELPGGRTAVRLRSASGPLPGHASVRVRYEASTRPTGAYAPMSCEVNGQPCTGL